MRLSIRLARLEAKAPPARGFIDVNLLTEEELLLVDAIPVREGRIDLTSLSDEHLEGLEAMLVRLERMKNEAA